MGDFMSSIIVSGDTSGAITIAAPAVSGTNTLTLPASTGTVALTSQLPVSGPVFSAYANATQTLTSAAYTKININTEEFDSNSNFDTSTYRFTPTVAGYYQINGCVRANTPNNEAVAAIYKNGSVYKVGSNTIVNSGTSSITVVSSIVYFNGSTDYIELWCYVGATSTTSGNSYSTYFNGSMVRAA